ncbi:MAG: S8 family serine peptidase [Romboutsia sp.]
MRKVKVAIVDTGIDINRDNLKKYIGDFSYKINHHDFEDSVLDINGHGTLCALSMLEITNCIEIYPIKIFDRNCSTSSLYLVEALKNLLGSDIDIINLSVATLNETYKEQLEDVCNQLYAENKIIVSSYHNKGRGKNSYPTYFKSVIGVKGNNRICLDRDYIYRINENIQMQTNAKKCFYKFNKNIVNFGKNSRAAALATGIIAKTISENNLTNINDIESKLLEGNCISIPYKNYRFLHKKKFKKDKLRQEIANKLINIIKEKFTCQELDLELLEKFSLFNNITNLGEDNAYDFLEAINEGFNININYREVFLYELANLYSIVELIYQKNKN